MSALDDLAGERVVSETAQEGADAVATWIAAQSRRAYGDHGSFSIALSGGSTPRMLNELHGAELHGALDRVLRRYVRAELLVIDDFALLAMDPAQAKLAFQVISERYDYRRPTAITTNRPFKDWTKVFPDALNAQVIAERLTERAETFVFEGKGYRDPR